MRRRDEGVVVVGTLDNIEYVLLWSVLIRPTGPTNQNGHDACEPEEHAGRKAHDLSAGRAMDNSLGFGCQVFLANFKCSIVVRIVRYD